MNQKIQNAEERIKQAKITKEGRELAETQIRLLKATQEGKEQQTMTKMFGL